jgi:hypothetical protein
VNKKKDKKQDFVIVRAVVAKAGVTTSNGLVFSEEALKTAASSADNCYYDTKKKELTMDVQVPCIKG